MNEIGTKEAGTTEYNVEIPKGQTNKPSLEHKKLGWIATWDEHHRKYKLSNCPPAILNTVVHAELVENCDDWEEAKSELDKTMLAIHRLYKRDEPMDARILCEMRPLIMYFAEHYGRFKYEELPL